MTLTSMASDEEGREAVNAVKVPLFHVGLPSNRHLYPNVAAQMSIMETAKGMGVEPNRVGALDVLLLVVSKFAEGTPAYRHGIHGLRLDTEGGQGVSYLSFHRAYCPCNPIVPWCIQRRNQLFPTARGTSRFLPLSTR